MCMGMDFFILVVPHLLILHFYHTSSWISLSLQCLLPQHSVCHRWPLLCYYRNTFHTLSSHIFVLLALVFCGRGLPLVKKKYFIYTLKKSCSYLVLPNYFFRNCYVKLFPFFSLTRQSICHSWGILVYLI